MSPDEPRTPKPQVQRFIASLRQSDPENSLTEHAQVEAFEKSVDALLGLDRPPDAETPAAPGDKTASAKPAANKKPPPPPGRVSR